jgi:hypothetical protein
MSAQPTREELVQQAEMARLQAELALARAEAAQLRLEMATMPAASEPSPLATQVKESPAGSVTSGEVATAAVANGTERSEQASPSAVALATSKNGNESKPDELAVSPKQAAHESTAAVKETRSASGSPSVNGANRAKSAKSNGGASSGRSGPQPSRSVGKELPASGKGLLTTAKQPLRSESSFGWQSRQLFQLLGAWTTSIIVHAACLIVLAIMMLPALLKPEPPLLEASAARPDELVTELLEEQLTPATEVTMNTATSAMLPTGHQSPIEGVALTEAVYDREVAESVDGPMVNIGDVSLFSVRGRDLVVDVPQGAPGDPQAVVDNYDQAFDRITQEILMMLVKSKVLVVWVFDQSESMKDDQQEIRQRIDRVYTELGLSGATKGDALLTAVASFGSKWQMHTRKPTYDLEEIRAAIDEVPVDESGLEMMCEAVGSTATALHAVATSGRRQLAMILVTDESGDQKTNVELLEPAIQAAKTSRCRVYVLGRESVFGYPYAHMRWSHPTVGVRWLPIDRGPETPYAEQLQTEGFQRRYDAHPSGFGPYEQARLARETGGIFFMLPSLETRLVRGERRRYELEAMRPYLPDLSARDEYAHDRDSNPLHATLWTVIRDLNPYDPVKAKVIDLRLEFSPNIETFGKQVAEEQAKAKIYVTYLHAAEQALQALEKVRLRETYPRWQANYDLIFAQVLAYKVRVYEYGAYLEEFKKNPKEVPLTKKPNLRLAHWDIRHRQQTITGELTEQYIERSRQMFAQVIQQHAGTPWAARAEYELQRGFGIDLVEEYRGPPSKSRPKGPPVKIPKL